MQKIYLSREFACDCDTLFHRFADHEGFGRIVGSAITRIKDSDGVDLNGKGSIRRIAIMPGLSFEETIEVFEAPHRIEYVVSKGSPVKAHRGVISFTPEGESTLLIYTIEFAPKLPIPGLGALLKMAIERPIAKGLDELAKSFVSKPFQ